MTESKSVLEKWIAKMNERFDFSKLEYKISTNDLLYVYKVAPPGIVEKLRLAPTEKLEPRMRHFFYLFHLARLRGGLKHIEGVGVGYDVHMSDISLGGMELDVTFDRRLVDSKLSRMKEKFKSAGVQLGPKNFTVDCSSVIVSNELWDMFKRLREATDKDRDDFLRISDAILKDSIEHSKFPNAPKPGPEWRTEPKTDCSLISWMDKTRVDLSGLISRANLNMKDYDFNVGPADEEGIPAFAAILNEAATIDVDDYWLVELRNDCLVVTKNSSEAMDIYNNCEALESSKIVAVLRGDKHTNCFRAMFSSVISNMARFNKISDDKPDSDWNGKNTSRQEGKCTKAEVKRMVANYELSLPSEAPVGPDLSKFSKVSAQFEDDESRNFFFTTMNSARISLGYTALDHMSYVAETTMMAQFGCNSGRVWRIGKNGHYNSFTVSNITGTTDSFEMCSYFVIYQPAESYALVSGVNEISCTPLWTISRNGAEWAVKSPKILLTAIASRLTSEKVSALTTSTVNELALAVNVNRDTFSQQAEQTRYLFMSGLSRKDNISTILNKKVVPIFAPRKSYELVYILRMIKMAEWVTETAINSGGGEVMRGPFDMPTTFEKVENFESVINEFYICNLFNKFRTFKLSSSALNYLNLLDEKDIYSARERFINGELDKITGKDLAGITAKLVENKEQETNFISGMIDAGSSRFSFSSIFLLNAFLREPSKTVRGTQSESNMKKSPIEACTMRGSMTPGVVSSSQSERVVNVILKGAAASMMTHSVTDLESMSIYVLKCAEMLDTSPYRSRTTPKDQKGHREISVLNYLFRIGALFVEEVSKGVAISDKDDVLNKPDKKKIFSDTLRFKADADDVADSNDQSRWGPNALMELFALGVVINYEDDDVAEMMVHTMSKVRKKLMKVPEDVISWFRSKTPVNLNTTLGDLLSRIGRNTIEMEFRFGMGQGILHQTSSLFHCVINRAMAHMCRTRFAVKATLITSDDSFRLLKVEGVYNPGQVEAIIDGVMGLGNVIRNKAKSTLSRHMSEFNSIFYHNGKMVPPFMKHVTSRVDCGTGMNVVTDLLNASASGTSSLVEGSPLVLSNFVGSMSLICVIDQWNWWSAKAELPVYRGGLPMISTLVALTAGLPGLASLGSGTDRAVANLWAAIAISPTIEIPVSMTKRIGSSLEGKVKLDRDGKVMPIIGEDTISMEKGISNLVNLKNYKKGAFKARTKVKLDLDSEEHIELDSKSPSAISFAFHIKSAFKNSAFLSQKHDFYRRYTEPKVSLQKKVYMTNSGKLLNRLEMMGELSELRIEDLGPASSEVFNVILGLTNRAEIVSDAICSAYTGDSEPNLRMIPATITCDHITEIDNSKLKEMIFKDLRRKGMSTLDSLNASNSFCNVIYSHSPVTVSSFIPTKYPKTISGLVTGIISERTDLKVKKALAFTTVPPVYRYITDEGSKVFRSKLACSEKALNMFLNTDCRRSTAVAAGAELDTSILTPSNKFTSEFRSMCYMSASGERPMNISAGGMASILRSGSITRSIVRTGSFLVKLLDDVVLESANGAFAYGRLQIIDMVNGLYTHHILVDKQPVDFVMHSDNPNLGVDSCYYTELEDTGPIKIMGASPFLAVTMGSATIPLFYVKPKMYSGLEAFYDDNSISKFNYIPDMDLVFNSAECEAIIDRCLTNSSLDSRSDIANAVFGRLKYTMDVRKRARTMVGNNMIGSKLRKVSGKEVVKDEAKPVMSALSILDMVLAGEVDVDFTVEDEAAAEDQDVLESITTYRMEASPLMFLVIRIRTAPGLAELKEVLVRALETFSKEFVVCAAILA